MQHLEWWATLVFYLFLLCFVLPVDLYFRIFTPISLIGKMDCSGLPRYEGWLFLGMIAGSFLLFALPLLFMLDAKPPGTAPLWQSAPAAAAGLGCLASGIVLSGGAIAQWARVYFFGDERDLLITTGAYGRVRNPIYLGLTLAFVGLWLLRPTIVLLPVLLCYAMCNHWRIRLEETHLESRFGEAYRQYCRLVGRYVPRLTAPQDSEARGPTGRRVTREER